MPDMADIRISHYGIRCIIIDYTLSRLETGKNTNINHDINNGIVIDDEDRKRIVLCGF
jgi:hypothetical protein